MSDNDPDEQNNRVPSAVLSLFGQGIDLSSGLSSAAQVVGAGSIAAGVGGACSIGGRYGSIKDASVRAPAPGRDAPEAVNKAVRLGDVAYFDANHAVMCVGFNKKGQSLWCSDTYQGTHFFANGACQQGTYILYRNTDPHYDAQKAVDTIMRNAKSTYTGNCAKDVRGGIEAATGHALEDRPGTAAGYNARNNHSLEDAGFNQIKIADAGSRVKSPSVGV